MHTADDETALDHRGVESRADVEGAATVTDGTYRPPTLIVGEGAGADGNAWFIGHQGDVAFAVVVDGGGLGGSVAAPIAADCLRTAAEQS